MSHLTSQSNDRRKDEASPVVVFGLGPVGSAVLQAAVGDPRFDVVACVDPREDRAVVASESGFGGPVLPSPDGLEPDAVAILCTHSDLGSLVPVATAAMEKGCDVVSTCEQLIAPRLADPLAVAALDDSARTHGRTVISSGVNPGFVMDVLPAVLTLASRTVERIRVTRSVDVSHRRQRLQDKVGVGISVEDFKSRRARSQVGHVGLMASLVFLADALGWHGRSNEQLEPVLGTDGMSLGVRHTAEVKDERGRTRINGLLEMYAGADDRDRIEIEGTPSITADFPNGVSGDEATVSTTLNVAAAVDRLPAGLASLADLLPPTWRAFDGVAKPLPSAS
jgi:2,4-diaminopentanoate dehydrogenase